MQFQTLDQENIKFTPTKLTKFTLSSRKKNLLGIIRFKHAQMSTSKNLLLVL